MYATGETAQAVANKIYQSLFYFDRQGNIRPELVERVSAAAPALEISLTLKKGARFADGSALGSRDVVATVALLKNPLYEYPYLSDLDFLEKIEATGPLSLRLRLKERFRPLEKLPDLQDTERRRDRESRSEKIQAAASPGAAAPTAWRPWTNPGASSSRKTLSGRGRQRFARIRYSVLAEPRQAPLKLSERRDRRGRDPGRRRPDLCAGETLAGEFPAAAVQEIRLYLPGVQPEKSRPRPEPAPGFLQPAAGRPLSWTISWQGRAKGFSRRSCCSGSRRARGRSRSSPLPGGARSRS